MRSYFAFILLLLILHPTVQSSFSLKTALHSYSQYSDWKELFGISYDTVSEDAYRFGVWLLNVRKIQHHNKHSGASYTLGQNQFTGMTSDQFQAYVNQINLHHTERPKIIERSVEWVGEDIDWEDKGAVNPVRNQGSCGASYAFSAAGTIQGQYFLKKGLLIALSWQQFIDCSNQAFGNNGCVGGTVPNCYRYGQIVGLVSEASYPYKASAGKCMVSSGPLRVANSFELPPSCSTIQVILQKGPISVTINARHMQSYHSGIFNGCNDWERGTQGALLVGQDSKSWKVQMSFGSKWGVSGYVYLAQGNTCNICETASQAYL